MAKADQVVKQILDYLEERVDLDHVDQVAARHQAALNYDQVDRLPLTCYLPYEGTQFTPYPRSEAFGDPAKIMVNELLVGFTSIYHAVELKDDTPYCLRPNLGVGIVASMFGAQMRLIEDQMPWVVPLSGPEQVQAIVDSALPDVHNGLGQQVLDQYAYFRQALADYPRCRAAFQLTLPDLQGPFAIAELLWGSAIYLAFYDQEALLVALLDKISAMILAAYRRFKEEVCHNLAPDCQYQHAVAVKGKLLIRNDSIINISPAQYRDVVQPFDARLAAELDCIGIHFCGNGQHQIDNLLAVPGLDCLDLGQPEMVDLDAIYARASTRHVSLARVKVPEPELTTNQVIRRFPTGVNLVYEAESVAKARQIWQRYRDDGYLGC